MTIRRWGRNLQDAVRPFNAADELLSVAREAAEDTPVPEPSAPPENLAWPYGTPRREVAEAEAVRTAEAAAAEAREYQAYPDAGMAEAKAMLAVAASVDALREAITDRLDLIAEKIFELKED